MSAAVARLAPAAVTCRTAKRTPLRRVFSPCSFRFSDANATTGRSFAQSRFHELPQQVASVVTDRLHLTLDVWDALVQDGEVHGFVGAEAVFEVWQTREGWRSRQFARPGTEVLDVEDDGVWF
ncbi:hypothetical protein GCM10011609_49220 [Lentzea pudingi]|uniref:Uncharacterized protein n=1 Tax=Lentzea pudingi TaxID=1789439 RepID=A0ABQ2IBP7_9PSEU|nr:hypothetical protein [Lentzea pudingi]GGN04155.1 hypothetical protein GCM10011609_49220 [Lentzea pudingi]